MLRGTDAQKANAACALVALTVKSETNRVKIAGQGAIPWLVVMLSGTQDRRKRPRMRWERSLVRTSHATEFRRKHGGVKPLVALLMEMTSNSNMRSSRWRL